MPTAAELRAYAERRARELGADPQEILAIGDRESSGFNPNIRDSPRGAIGVMQLMPDTARGLGVDPRDPFQNIEGGIRYYQQQRQRFGSPILAAAAYNAGPGAVRRHGGVPPFRETQDYVAGFPGPRVRRGRGGAAPAAQVANSDDIFGFSGNGGGQGQAAPAPAQAQNSDDIFGFAPERPARQRRPANVPPAPPPMSGATASGPVRPMTPADRQQIDPQALLTFTQTHDPGAVARIAPAPRRTPPSGFIGATASPTPRSPPQRVNPGAPANFIQSIPTQLITAAGAAGLGLAERVTGRRMTPPPTSTNPIVDVPLGAASGVVQGLIPTLSGGSTVQGDAAGFVSTLLPAGVAALDDAGRRVDAMMPGIAARLPARPGPRVTPADVTRMSTGLRGVLGAGLSNSGDVVNSTAGNATGLNYQPGTGFGQSAQRFGQMAPMAVISGGAVPTLMGFAAGEAGRFAAERGGGSPEQVDAAGFAGNLAGGVASGIRFGGGRVPVPGGQTSLDPTVTMRPSDVVAAARYVERQVPRALPPGAPILAPRGATLAEQLGPNARRALGGLATRDGASGDLLLGNIDERTLTRSERYSSDFERASGIAPSDAQTSIDALVTAGRNRVRPLFREAENDPTPVSSPRLTQLAETEVVQNALREAYKDLANDVDSPTPAANVFRVTPEGVQILEPTMQTWDRVYQVLSRQIERNPITGRILPDTQSPGNVRVNKVRAQLRQELGAQNRTWDQAMTQAGEYMPLAAAYDDGGRMFFNQKITEAQYRQRLARLSESERPAFVAGIANRIFDLVQTDKMSARSFRSPRMRDRLNQTVGEERATELIDALQSEEAMLAFERRYAPEAGSRTADLRQAHAEQDGTTSVGGRLAEAGTGAIGDMIKYGTRAPLVWAWQGVEAAGRGAASRMRNNGLTPAARDEAGRLLASRMTPAELEAHLARTLGRPVPGPTMFGVPLRAPPRPPPRSPPRP